MPDDPTPLGDAMTHRFPDQKVPEPESGAQSGERAAARNAAPDVSQRPALPSHPEQMAADIEDEEADPVIDSGPGIADGPASLKKQRG